MIAEAGGCLPSFLPNWPNNRGKTNEKCWKKREKIGGISFPINGQFHEYFVCTRLYFADGRKCSSLDRFFWNGVPPVTSSWYDSIFSTHFFSSGAWKSSLTFFRLLRRSHPWCLPRDLKAAKNWNRGYEIFVLFSALSWGDMTFCSRDRALAVTTRELGLERGRESL